MQTQSRTVLLVAVLALASASALARPQNGRHLLNPIYAERNSLVGPDTPSFRYRATHPPASYKTETKVRSEHPSVQIENTQKDWINSKGGTTVNTWDGAKLVHNTGKGGVDFKFNSGKRAFRIVEGSTHNVNFDQTKVAVGGGIPLAVDHKSQLSGYTNSSGVFALGDGPVYRNSWNVTAGAALAAAVAPGLGAVGAGLVGGLAGGLDGHSHGRKLMNPIYAERNSLVGPDTPSFRYRATHPPASYKTETKVRSEHPSVQIENTQKDWINSKGGTTVNTWDGAKLVHNTGKGGVDFKFNSGKRAFRIVEGSTHNVNFDQTKVAVGGGIPLAVDHKSQLSGYTNSSGVFALGDGPVYRNSWNVTAGAALAAAVAPGLGAVGAGLVGGLAGGLDGHHGRR